MSKHGTPRSKAGEAPLTLSESRRYYALLKKQGKALLSHPDTVRLLLKKPKKVGLALLALVPSKDPYAEVRRQWEKFYQKFFGLTVDLSAVRIPDVQADFSRLIIVAQGITLNVAMAACKKRFPTWQYSDDLDASVIENNRTAAGGAYAVWFRSRVEADEETKNKSANDLGAEHIKGITLLERILMELEYFGRTGQHLDIQNVTLCSGSRNSDGFVPCAYWRGGRFDVTWSRADYSCSSLRARVAVS